MSKLCAKCGCPTDYPMGCWVRGDLIITIDQSEIRRNNVGSDTEPWTKKNDAEVSKIDAETHDQEKGLAAQLKEEGWKKGYISAVGC
jgi:hypothetical protein